MRCDFEPTILLAIVQAKLWDDQLEMWLGARPVALNFARLPEGL